MHFFGSLSPLVNAMAKISSQATVGDSPLRARERWHQPLATPA